MADKWFRCPIHGIVNEDYCRWCGSGQYCEHAPAAEGRGAKVG